MAKIVLALVTGIAGRTGGQGPDRMHQDHLYSGA